MAIAGCKPPPSHADGPEIDLSSYALTFNEDFQDFDVSPWGPGTRWIAHTAWDGDFGDAPFADPEPGFPFTTSADGLRIEARKFEDGSWRSGLICSLMAEEGAPGGFSQQYGYFEMRAKMPDGPGVWPAFWLITGLSYPRGEIDVIEYYGHDRNHFFSATAVWRADAEDDIDGTRTEVPAGSLCDQYNDYGVAIDHDAIVMYLNKREFWRAPTPPEMRVPMSLLANLALGSGYPINKLKSPQFMDIQHIRAYAKKG